MRAFALAAFLSAPMLLQTAAPAHAQSVRAHSALAAARLQVQNADYRMSGQIVRVDSSGKRTRYGVTIEAHWFPGVLRVLVKATSPAEARVHVLLEMRPGGKSTILIAHPGDAAAKALPFKQWRAELFGASPSEGFSYEDFLDATYFWAGQKDLGEVKYGARNCDELRSTPEAADKTHYAEVTSWLDRSSGFPVYVEKTLKDSGDVKEFTYFGLRQTEGVWYANQVEEKTHGHSGSTLLVINHGAARAHLDLKDFSAARLTHF